MPDSQERPPAPSLSTTRKVPYETPPLLTVKQTATATMSRSAQLVTQIIGRCGALAPPISSSCTQTRSLGSRARLRTKMSPRGSTTRRKSQKRRAQSAAAVQSTTTSLSKSSGAIIEDQLHQGQPTMKIRCDTTTTLRLIRFALFKIISNSEARGFGVLGFWGFGFRV